MQLNVRELSKFLSVTERTIYRWIKLASIPFYKIHDQYRFNRLEILEWATARKINISQEMLQDQEDKVLDLSLAETIQSGGIYYRVEGRNKKELLTSVINLLNLPADIDRKDILNAVLIREELGSTGFGDGIAIPHARYPIVTHIPNVIVSVSFAENPVDFQALDNKPVNCLFTLISPTVRSHLKTLSRIAFVLRDEKVKSVLVEQKSREVILTEIKRVEQSLK